MQTTADLQSTDDDKAYRCLGVIICQSIKWDFTMCLDAISKARASSLLDSLKVLIKEEFCAAFSFKLDEHLMVND